MAYTNNPYDLSPSSVQKFQDGNELVNANFEYIAGNYVTTEDSNTISIYKTLDWGQSYLTSGDWIEIVQISPSGSSQNYQVVGQLTIGSGTNASDFYFDMMIRSQSLPDLEWVLKYGDLLNGDTRNSNLQMVTWYDATNGVLKLLVKSTGTVHDGHVRLDVNCRNNYSGNVDASRQGVYTAIETGFAETVGTYVKQWHDGNFNPDDYLAKSGYATTGSAFDSSPHPNEAGWDIKTNDAHLLFGVDSSGRPAIASSGTGTAYDLSFVPEVGRVFINNQVAWHAGNFTPSDYLLDSGGTVTGKVTYNNANYDNHIQIDRSSYSWSITPTTGSGGLLRFITNTGAGFQFEGGNVDVPSMTVGGKWDLTDDNNSKVSGHYFHNFHSEGTDTGQGYVMYYPSATTNKKSNIDFRVGTLTGWKRAWNLSTDAATFDIPLQQNGNQVWHEGNFTPSNYLRSDVDTTLDGSLTIETETSGTEHASGLLTLKNNKAGGEAAMRYITDSLATGNAWYTGLNNDSSYRISYGGSNTNANTMLIINTAGVIGGDGSGLTDVDADKLDGLHSSSFLRSDADNSSVRIGNRVTLSESSDRANLLEITSTTSGWGGLQIRNSSNEGRWSFMTDGNSAGIYDDENNDWHIYMTENAGVSLRYNTAERLSTTSAGVSITGTLSGDGSGLTSVDADKLDNLNSTQFLRSDTSDTFNGELTFNGEGVGSGTRFYNSSGNDAGGIRLNNSSGNNGELEFWTSDDYSEPFVFRAYDVGTTGTGTNQEWFRIDQNKASYKGDTIWHAGNDGANSGLDADKLDGIHASGFVQSGSNAQFGTYIGFGNDAKVMEYIDNNAQSGDGWSGKDAVRFYGDGNISNLAVYAGHYHATGASEFQDVNIQNEKATKYGGKYAIQYNAATDSLDFNFTG